MRSNKFKMNSTAKRVKYDEAVPNKDMSDLLAQFEKEATANSEEEPTSIDTKDISQTLHHLEEGITSIRYSLEKPKSKRVSLNEVNRKVDLILEILNSWNTSNQ